MKKIVLLTSLMLTSGFAQAAEPQGTLAPATDAQNTSIQAAETLSTGEAAGAAAATEARGNSDAIGLGALGALLGVALATAGGGSDGSTTTNTQSGR